MAKASMTRLAWRCQPCQERVSLWSRPSSVLAVPKLSSMVPAATHWKGTPALMARPTIRTASQGLVANPTSSGTCAAASRALSPVHALGR